LCDRHTFSFNLALAYTTQAVDQFERSPMHLLAKHEAPKRLGVYALYLSNEDDKPIYVGKATRITLARRLAEHWRKIKGRENTDVDRMWCRYLVIGDVPGEEWVAASAENALIAHYSPKWNRSGIGSHVPGAGRPGTAKVSVFDQMHPPRKK
jgi:hypothetical protein